MNIYTNQKKNFLQNQQCQFHFSPDGGNFRTQFDLSTYKKKEAALLHTQCSFSSLSFEQFAALDSKRLKLDLRKRPLVGLEALPLWPLSHQCLNILVIWRKKITIVFVLSHRKILFHQDGVHESAQSRNSKFRVDISKIAPTITNHFCLSWRINVSFYRSQWSKTYNTCQYYGKFLVLVKCDLDFFLTLMNRY